MYNFPQGNMPLSVGYNVFYGQVLRYSNIISDLENCISATKQLYRILLRRGYDDEQLKRKFRGLIRGRPDILHKYNVQDINDIQDLVFNIWHIGVAIGIPRSPKDKVHLKVIPRREDNIFGLWPFRRFAAGCGSPRWKLQTCGYRRVTAGGLGNYLRSWYSTPETELYAKLSADESAATYRHYELRLTNDRTTNYFIRLLIISSVSPGWVFLLQEFQNLSVID